MRFRILGPLEVCGSDGEMVSLRAPTTGRCTAQGDIGYALLCGKMA